QAAQRSDRPDLFVPQRLGEVVQVHGPGSRLDHPDEADHRAGARRASARVGGRETPGGTDMSPTATASRWEAEFELPIGYTDEQGVVHRKVVLRKMTGKEEAILADRRNQRNGGKLVTELLHSCLVRLGDLPKNGTATVERMYSADRNFLLLKLRSITFGP